MNLKKIALLIVSLSSLAFLLEAMISSSETIAMLTQGSISPRRALIMICECSNVPEPTSMEMIFNNNAPASEEYIKILAFLVQANYEPAYQTALTVHAKPNIIGDLTTICRSLITKEFELLPVLKLIEKIKKCHAKESSHPEGYYDYCGYRTDEEMQEVLDLAHWGPCATCQTCKDLSFIFNQCKRVYCEVENARNSHS